MDKYLQESKVVIENRKSLNISGVKQIDSFDSNEFVLETVLGYLHVKGKDLILGKMDNDNQQVSIKGTIDSLVYLDGKKGRSKESFVKKIFK